jgi:hypothetical protein
LIPAYFRLLEFLDRERAAGKSDFGVVIRTFGHDLPAVVQEHNWYCADGSTHPLRGREGEGGSLAHAAVSVPLNTGVFKRWDEPGVRQGHGIALALPQLVEGSTWDADTPGVVDLSVGVEAVHDIIVARVRRGHCALALRDDYSYWKRHDETGHAGKLLLLPRGVHGVAVQEFALFFDDNVGHEELNIVDARDAHTGEPVAHAEVAGTHVVRAEIALALIDPDYFVRHVQRGRQVWAEAEV